MSTFLPSLSSYPTSLGHHNYLGDSYPSSLPIDLILIEILPSHAPLGLRCPMRAVLMMTRNYCPISPYSGKVALPHHLCKLRFIIPCPSGATLPHSGIAISKEGNLHARLLSFPLCPGCAALIGLR